MSRPKPSGSPFLADVRKELHLRPTQVIGKLRKLGIEVERSAFSKWERGLVRCPPNVQVGLATIYGIPHERIWKAIEGLAESVTKTEPSTIDSGKPEPDNTGPQPTPVPAPTPPSPPSTPPSPEEYKLPHKLVSFLVAHLTAGLYVMSVDAQRVTIRSLRGHLDAAAGPLGEEQAPAVRVSNSRHQ